MTIYSDGSFKDGVCGSGVVVFTDENYIRKLYFYTDDSILARYRNITGELLAAMLALKVIQAVECESVTYVYDLYLIGALAKGTREPYTPIARAFKNLYDSVSLNVNLRFSHIPGHGRPKNHADEVAKIALDKKSNVPKVIVNELIDYVFKHYVASDDSLCGSV